MLSASAIKCKAQETKCFDVEGLIGNPPDPTEWKVIDHCAAITRMYAVFEGFVDSVLRDYLNFLNSNYEYGELDEGFRSNYIRGVGLIVAESYKQRYQHLPVHSLAADLASALAGETPYRLTVEAMLIQEQNLRLGELERIFGHCGLSGLRTWIEHHPAITNFFSSTARVSDTAEAELREIVGFRNEAAHGDVDNVLGVAVLTEFVEFIFHLCAAIAEFVQKDMVTRLLTKQQFHDAGEVTEIFRGNVMVGKIENATVAVGDTVYLAGRYLCSEAKVISLQLENVDVESVDATETTEVGFKLDVGPRKKSRILVQAAAQGPPAEVAEPIFDQPTEVKDDGPA